MRSHGTGACTSRYPLLRRGFSNGTKPFEPRASILLTQVRQSDPEMIKSIMDAVTIPVMAKIRIGHFVEAQVSTRAPNPIRLFV